MFSPLQLIVFYMMCVNVVWKTNSNLKETDVSIQTVFRESRPQRTEDTMGKNPYNTPYSLSMATAISNWLCHPVSNLGFVISMMSNYFIYIGATDIKTSKKSQG